MSSQIPPLAKRVGGHRSLGTAAFERRHLMIPYPNWKRITVEETVDIPARNGEDAGATLRVPVNAWQNPDDGEIYLDAVALNNLDNIRARHMGLMPPQETWR